MRDYLFRGKRKDNGEYIEGLPFYGLTAGLNVHVSIIPYGEVVKMGEKTGQKFSDTWEMQEVERDTISPYIGMNDKNGRKIFEGDIVKMQFEDEEEEFPPEYLTVYYDEKMCSFLCHSDQTTMPVECDLLNQGEIVGNIYDDPELCTKKPIKSMEQLDKILTA